MSLIRRSAYTSPVQMYNLYPGNSRPNEIKILLHPTPFGARKPLVPVARSITVSRIASPLSVDRGFESACLNGLRRHLQKAPRLLKQGDIITVLIDTDHKFEMEEVDLEPNFFKWSVIHCLSISQI